MAKRFAYVSFGILCLVIAYQVGAKDARADWVGVGQAWGVTSGGGSSDDYLVISADGTAWTHRLGTWTQRPDVDLPIDPTAVKFLEGHGEAETYLLVATDDRTWSWSGGLWRQGDPFPGGPVSLDEQSWGKTKAAYR